MADGHSNTLPKPAKRSRRWTSFVGAPASGRVVRSLQEELYLNPHQMFSDISRGFVDRFFVFCHDTNSLL